MRRRKQKALRKTLRFYRINFGFRPPYKVLLDGNFVHALDQMKKGEAKDLIFRLLGEPVKCYTTGCVQAELKKMGKELSGARQLLKRYPLHHCGHEEQRCSAADCLLAQLGASNGEHFFVASQDKSLQRQCMAVPGGAVLFASVNGIHLEAPSEAQRQTVAAAEQQHLVPSAAERQSAALQDLATPGARGGGAGGAGGTGPKIRRRRTKGPNPLAVKPKKKKEGGGGGGQQQPQQQQQPAAAAGGGEQPAKRKRKRKRGKGDADGGGGGGSE